MVDLAEMEIIFISNYVLLFFILYRNTANTSQTLVLTLLEFYFLLMRVRARRNIKNRVKLISIDT